MYNKCCVLGCESSRKNCAFYKIPTSERSLMWLNCEKFKHLRELNPKQLEKCFVCVKHFEKKCFTESIQRSRLRQNAIPTLFSETEILNGIADTGAVLPIDQTTKNHCNPRKRRYQDTVDHTYCKKIIIEEPSLLCTVSTVPALEEPTPFCDSEVDTIVDCHITGGVVIPRRNCRSNRRIQTLKSLVPLCANLYREFKLAKKQSVFNDRAKQALKFTKKNDIEKMTQNMDLYTKRLMWLQVKRHTKSARRCCFSDEEKSIALCIMKQNPKSYTFLQRIFVMPSKNTLKKMLAGIKIGPGINPQIFEAMKNEVHTWKENKKYCSVLFDEVALDTGLHYDRQKDVINGFIHLVNRTNEFADRALVFMLRGALHEWQQPVAFYFSRAETNGHELTKLFKEVITSVSGAGLIPIALICDQRTSFQLALKSLQKQTKERGVVLDENTDDVIKISGRSLNIIYDPSQLIKGIRNNFLRKHIIYNDKISKWSDIVGVYKRGKSNVLNKLKDKNVIPAKIKKSKVDNCFKVFSKTVAATLSFTSLFSQDADGNQISTTLRNTSEIVFFIDKLFDSVNGASCKKSKEKPLRCAVTSKSPHHTFWKDAITTLKKLKFINKNGQEISVPTIRNWVITLQSYQRLWKFFEQKGVKTMYPRYFNLEAIDSFLNDLREYNFCNNYPNCQVFTTTFRSLLITTSIKFHPKTFDFEKDSGEQVLKLQSLFETKHKTSNTLYSDTNKPLFVIIGSVRTGSDKSIYEDAGSPLICSNETKINGAESSIVLTRLNCETSPEYSERFLLLVRREQLHLHSEAYSTGWIISKILNSFKCSACESYLRTNIDNLDNELIKKFVSIKEYSSIKIKKMIYPSEQAVRIYRLITEETNFLLESLPQNYNLMSTIKLIINSKLSFDSLSCEIHKMYVKEYLIEYTFIIAIYNWCNIINNTLKGRDVFRLQNKKLPPMRSKALSSYKSKLRKYI